MDSYVSYYVATAIGATERNHLFDEFSANLGAGVRSKDDLCFERDSRHARFDLAEGRFDALVKCPTSHGSV